MSGFQTGYTTAVIAYAQHIPLLLPLFVKLPKFHQFMLQVFQLLLLLLVTIPNFFIFLSELIHFFRIEIFLDLKFVAQLENFFLKLLLRFSLSLHDLVFVCLLLQQLLLQLRKLLPQRLVARLQALSSLYVISLVPLEQSNLLLVYVESLLASQLVVVAFAKALLEVSLQDFDLSFEVCFLLSLLVDDISGFLDFSC